MSSNQTLTVKVISCAVPTYWYAKEIGNTFKVKPWLGKYIAIERIKGKREPAFDSEDVEITNEIKQQIL